MNTQQIEAEKRIYGTTIARLLADIGDDAGDRLRAAANILEDAVEWTDAGKPHLSRQAIMRAKALVQRVANEP